MAAATPKFKFGFVLKDGPTNLRFFKENSTTQTFNKGSLVKLSTAGLLSDQTTESDTGSTVTISADVWGVAQKDHTSTANSLIPVYVITPEQEWEVHCEKGIKPNTGAYLDEGDQVKLKYSCSTSYTLSDGDGNTNKTTVGAWQAKNEAATATRGATIVGHRRGEEGTKGGRVIVRFTNYICSAQA